MGGEWLGRGSGLFEKKDWNICEYGKNAML
jgi:hypothetical protein